MRQWSKNSNLKKRYEFGALALTLVGGVVLPARLMGVPYVVFWLMFAALLVLMRFVLLRSVDAHDPYGLLTFLIGIGIVWIASEIIWSYKALLKLRVVIGQIASESKRATVLNWYKNWLRFIYSFGAMALTGIFVAALFTPMISVQKALCWTGSYVVCNLTASTICSRFSLAACPSFHSTECPC